MVIWGEHVHCVLKILFVLLPERCDRQFFYRFSFVLPRGHCSFSTTEKEKGPLYFLGYQRPSECSSKCPEIIRQINSSSSWNLLKYFPWTDDNSMIKLEILKVSLHINNAKCGFSSALVVNVIFPHSGCRMACWQRELMHKAAA